MATLRKPCQGVGNIVRFNRRFFLLAATMAVGLAVTGMLLPGSLRTWAFSAAAAIVAATSLPLGISWWIYDKSGLYQLPWLDPWMHKNPPPRLVNLHSGFDETSAILADKFPGSKLTVLDFYDPVLHTESSIRLARKAYPSYPGTLSCAPDSLPVPDGGCDLVLVMFAAHEIRDQSGRDRLLGAIRRILAPEGRVFLVEHLRDPANIAAYHVGVFHFFPLHCWLRSFKAAGFLHRQSRHTPFITLFELFLS